MNQGFGITPVASVYKPLVKELPACFADHAEVVFEADDAHVFVGGVSDDDGIEQTVLFVGDVTDLF